MSAEMKCKAALMAAILVLAVSALAGADTISVGGGTRFQEHLDEGLAIWGSGLTLGTSTCDTAPPDSTLTTITVDAWWMGGCGSGSATYGSLSANAIGGEITAVGNQCSPVEGGQVPDPNPNDVPAWYESCSTMTFTGSFNAFEVTQGSIDPPLIFSGTVNGTGSGSFSWTGIPGNNTTFFGTFTGTAVIDSPDPPDPPTPEPGTLALMAIGIIGLLAVRKTLRPQRA